MESRTPGRPLTILALASEFKGIAYLEECKRLGVRITLLMNAHLEHEPWPWECIDGHVTLPDLRRQPDVTHLAARLARSHRLDHIVALDDYDVETVADLREHFRLDGMRHSQARFFRDKLAMRVQAGNAGLEQPRFTAVFNHAAVAAFIAGCEPPWVLKPRTLAGSEGIRKLHETEELWRNVHELGDQQSYFLLEQFVPGEVFHVDALAWDHLVVFALVSRYGAPPLAALQGRGIFSTRTLESTSAEAGILRALNERVLATMGRHHGPSHTEFIRAADGRFLFLETAARVAGGNIEKQIEAASGLSFWTEAARMDLATLRGEDYALPQVRDEHGGLIAAPSRQPYADTSAYSEPEIYFRPHLREFASLVLRSPSSDRIETLLEQYARRFREDFTP